MKRFTLISAGFAASAFSAGAVNILSIGDPIMGGQSDGVNFNVGFAGTSPGVNNWPAAEPPEDLINGVMGGGGEKYLNFAEFNTGVIVSPTFGAGSPTVVTGMTLFVANDAVERDPNSYQLYGTNAAINPGGPVPISSFTLISTGPLALPDVRDTIPDTVGDSETINFTNTAAYTSYMLLFPDVKNSAAANSMQISEWQLEGTVVPEPGTAMLAGLAALGLVQRRRR